MPYRESAKEADGSDQKESPKPELKSAQWWRAEELGQQPHEICDNIVKQIEDDQSGRYEAYKEFDKLFGSESTVYGTNEALGALYRDELAQNELASTIETLWAQVFKNKIVPAVCTSEASYEEWERAKGYGRWLEGVFDEVEVFERSMPMAGMDMFKYGTGLLKVLDEDDAEDDSLAHLRLERVHPKMCCVDRLESKNGRPRSFFQKDHVDRAQLFAIYAEDREDFHGTVIERAAGINSVSSNDDEELQLANISRCDMVTVREGWHLPSVPGAKDGKHIIWIKGCTLVYEDWSGYLNGTSFPFLFIRGHGASEGFWGESVVKRIGPLQKQLNKLNQKIDESQDVMGVPRILVRNGAGIRKVEIDDIPGGILETDDLNGIKDWNAQCITPEVYQEREGIPRKMRSLLGVSDFEAQQQIPQQMRDVSGAMLERWVDAGQARHAMTHREYENAICKLALLLMEQAERVQKRGRSVVVNSPGDLRTSVQSLDFKDVRIDRKKLKLKVLPMNQLPQTFAGKVEAIEKLKALLPMNPRTITRMLEVPDGDAQTDLMCSPEEIIMKNINFMVKNEKYLAPLPFDDLDSIVQLTTLFINNYRVRDDANPVVISCLAEYIDEAIQLKAGFSNGDTPSTMGAVGGPPMPPSAPMVPGQASGPGAPTPPGPTGMPPMQAPPMPVQ